MDPHHSRRHRLTWPSTFGLVLTLISILPATVAAAGTGWRTLAEMQEPEGVVVGTAAERETLKASRDGVEGIARMEAVVARDWDVLRSVDWPALSRHQVEATANWELPTAPGLLLGRILGRDATGRLHVEIRGPRLPARFDVVFRYVYLFGTYDPLTGEIDDLQATIRGWVEE